MIFGDPYKFALYIDKFFYLESISDWDCMCGYYINGQAYISDYSQILFVQLTSIKFGALANVKFSEELYSLPLEQAFHSLILKRYPNYVGTSKESFLEAEWIEEDEDYMVYSAGLESSLKGTVRHHSFVIGFKDNVRIISYEGTLDYFNLEKLNDYKPVECFLKISELNQIIDDCILFGKENIPNLKLD